MTDLPHAPAAWAIKISTLLQHIQSATGEAFYPIQIEKIAREVSLQFFPEDPITEICGAKFSPKFEGLLRPIPAPRGGWGIIYNDAIKSRGRINYTLAHELGHYLLHRAKITDGIQCSRDDMMKWDSAYGKLEAEANKFASYLLMPRNLFEDLIAGETINLHLMNHVANHFDVSVTATILKWLEFTPKRAMLVVARDGFIAWTRPSQNLRKSGIFLKTEQAPIELPAQSLAARKDRTFDNEEGLQHPAGVWPFKESVFEATLLAENYDMTISLLLFPDRAPDRFFEDAPEVEDTFDRLSRHS